jgi:hypothetical protein
MKFNSNGEVIRQVPLATFRLFCLKYAAYAIIGGISYYHYLKLLGEVINV